MPKLLISVRSAHEASLALAAGIDLIDVKEPTLGALGAASPQTIHEVLRLVNRRAATSVAYGELLQMVCDGPLPALVAGALPEQAYRPDYVKVGLSGCATTDNWPGIWRQVLQSIAPHATPVAVIYADWCRANSPPPAEVIEQARKLKRAAVLLDTFDKSGPGLLRIFSLAMVRALIDEIHALQMEVAVAGQLTLDDTVAVAGLGPDFVGVRGAVCRPDRNGDIDAQALSVWQSSIASAARRQYSRRPRSANAPAS